MAAFNQVLRNVTFDNLEVDDFRKALQEIVPEAKGYAESFMIAFIHLSIEKFYNCTGRLLDEFVSWWFFCRGNLGGQLFYQAFLVHYLSCGITHGAFQMQSV